MSGASLAGQPSPRFDATWTWNGLRMSSRGLGCAAAVELSRSKNVRLGRPRGVASPAGDG